MGFEIPEGPEIEEAEYNFHQAQHQRGPPRPRVVGHVLSGLRTAASSCARRPPRCRCAPWSKPLPIRMVAPGRVYRKDEVDATHSPMFHQIEGMVIDKGVTMADLKRARSTRS